MTRSNSIGLRSSSLSELLHAAFHRRNTRAYARMQAFVWTLIGISVLSFLAELILNLDLRDYRPWFLLDRTILALFATELALEILTYRDPSLAFFVSSRLSRLRTHVVGRMRFCFSPLVLIDFVTVLSMVPALRGLRALRFLRLMRTIKFFRYTSPALGVLRTFAENALLYTLTFGFLLSTVIIGGLSFFLIEQAINPSIESIADGFWWALVTITTVGFGDITPMTSLGRLVAGVVMILGMFTLALIAGLVGSTLLGVVLKLREEQFRMTQHYDHLVICGYEEGARMLLDTVLQELGGEPGSIVICGSQDRPRGLPPEFTWIRADPTKESELDKLQLSRASAALVVGSRETTPQQADAITILATFTIRSYLGRSAEGTRRNRPLYLVAEVLDSENVNHARSAGANEVIESTRLGFSLLAHSVSVHGSGEIMSSVATAGALSLYIGRYPYEAPKPYGAIARELKQAHGLTVIGLRDPRSGSVALGPRDNIEVNSDRGIIYLAPEPVLDPL